MQTRTELDRKDDMNISRSTIGELLGQLANNSASLVRDEIALVRQEMGEKVKSFRSGVVTVAVGAVVGLIAIMALTAAAIIGLAHLMDAGYAALIVGGLLAIVGGIIAVMGFNRLKQTSLKPEQTIETLEEDKEWLKDLT
jgi:Putative Actinobacterial Holin-X, holin superfamily III